MVENLVPPASGSSVVSNGSASEVERLLPSGDEAGTPPGDRRFRPDIQGMRAVAVLLVVLSHAQVTAFRGGFIGVDVFFVISGFVITGLLLRERSATGRTNILAFYGRRVRRIIPAAMFVIVVTVVAERILIGGTAVGEVASQARWASVFLADFPLVKENIFHPIPIPLGNYWSLAVEEQFYLVYPMLLVIAASIARSRSLRIKLALLLGATIAASLTWSVIASPVSVSAYISPFTRAWELAVGALLALFSDHLRRLPSYLAAPMTWLGLIALVVLAVVITGPDWLGGAYPGYLALLPVGATVLVIAGGTAVPRWGAESMLRLPPFKWVGLWSYSIYLWHYPILILAAQRWHTSVSTNLLLMVGAIALSAGTYFAIENPIRHSSFLTRFPAVSVAGGASLILCGLGIVTLVS